MNPFVALGLAQTFDIDLAAAQTRHRDLSRALHPDRFVGTSATEKRQALAKAVEVNEAWRIVRDPLLRAEALIRLSGASVRDDDGPRAEPAFLMEMLETREALAEAKSARDLSAVQRLAEAIQARIRAVQSDLSAGFARGECGSLVGKVGELRFYRRLLDDVVAVEDELAA
jgi:molecular chaperone HscB